MLYVCLFVGFYYFFIFLFFIISTARFFFGCCLIFISGVGGFPKTIIRHTYKSKSVRKQQSNIHNRMYTHSNKKKTVQGKFCFEICISEETSKWKHETKEAEKLVTI